MFISQGNYLYIEASAKTAGQTAVLNSPLVSPTPAQGSGYCFSFWYHMFGPHIGSLTVYTLTNGRKVQQWTKTGTQGNKWQQGYFDVKSLTDFQVSL